MTPIEKRSPAQIIADLPDEQRRAFYAQLSAEEAALLMYNWRDFMARPAWKDEDGVWHGQMRPPVEHTTWLFAAGRGAGKTRSGVEDAREAVEKGYRRLLFIARTASDARDVMIEGESGLLACYPEPLRPTYYPSKRLVKWHNGAVLHLRSADEPDQVRGLQSDYLWGDELAAWRSGEAWELAIMGNRLSAPEGLPPLRMVTTTPKNVSHFVSIYKDPTTVVTTASTYENAANLADSFIRDMRNRYAGTRLGEQELLAKLLKDVEGALWSQWLIDQHRIAPNQCPDMIDFERIVIGVDPAARTGTTGIVAAGRDARGHVYVLEDASTEGSTQNWVDMLIATYQNYQADAVVVETNHGGDMVRESIKAGLDGNAFMPNLSEVTASRGKDVRARQVTPFYEQGKVHHVGFLSDLESQMTTYDPEAGAKQKSDRMDALVWAITDLKFDGNKRHEPPGMMRGRINRPSLGRRRF